MLAVEHAPLLSHVESIHPAFLEGDLIQPGHPLFGLIWINRQRVSGAPCFYGTRVPVKALFDCLAAGQSLEEFLDDFEGVAQEQARAVLALAQSQLMAELPCA